MIADARDDRARPFHCGTQFVDWTARNCDRCALGRGSDPDVTLDDLVCELERAVTWACMDDGTVSREVADRIGATAAGVRALTWDCPERKL